MKSTRRQLLQPVELVCSQHAAALLSTAASECGRLGRDDDPEALHDFRVSVRRLRTYLEAYSRYTPKGAGKKMRKRLARVMSATNKGRDNQVQSEWLSLQLDRSNLPKLTRHGYTVALEGLKNSRPESAPDALSGVVREFTGLEDKLKARLVDPPLSIRLNEEGESISYAVVTGEMVRKLAAILRKRLAAIESLDQRKRVHRARLAAKRLRYVLEPVRAVVIGGRTAVRQLKEVQDHLGDLRDLQMMESRVRSILKQQTSDWSRELADSALRETTLSAVKKKGVQTEECRALAAAVHGLRRAETRVYDRLQRRWLKGNAEPFLQLVDKITLQLLPTEELARPPEERSKTPVSTTP